MIKLNEVESTRFEIGYNPENKKVLTENPPRFTFMLHSDEAKYQIEVSKTNDFNVIEYIFSNLEYNFFAPSNVFPEGTYFWRYAVVENGQVISNYSIVRSFVINSGICVSPLRKREERYTNSDLKHPRLWLNPTKVESFKKELINNPNYCDFNLFYDNAAKIWLNRQMPVFSDNFNYDYSEFKQAVLTPEPPLNPTKIRKRWRATYVTCQEVFYKIRHLAIAGEMTNDMKLIQAAKDELLNLCTWDLRGSTFHDNNDEAEYRVTRALGWGYDWLYKYLSKEEEKTVRETLYARLKYTVHYMMNVSKIHLTPFNSHPIRSINMVVIPCCIALFGHYPEVESWLNYATEYMYTIYTPWGGPNGGWAEGGLYWTTAMSAALDGINPLKEFTGINVYERVFFQKTGDFIMACYTPHAIRACFGDQSNLDFTPSLKTGFNMRQFASNTNNGNYQWYYESKKPWNTEEFKDFFNYGWWDFYAENMMHLYSFSDVKAVEPKDFPTLTTFEDVGWAAMHANYTDKENHIQLLFKSSPFGPISHSHADQNAFLIHAFDETLAIETGYYNDYGGHMHRNWCKQTMSENALLINGKGQYTFDIDLVYETRSYKKADMAKQINANGHLVDSYSNDKVSYVKGDATKAYIDNNPTVKSVTREIYFVDKEYFIAVDDVILTEEGNVSFLFHAMKEMTINNDNFKVTMPKASMDVRFVSVNAGIENISQHDDFTDVPIEVYAHRNRQWHLNMTTGNAKTHKLITLMVPYKNNDVKNVTYTINNDEVTFNNNGKTFVLKK